jgi:hypothetical protein
MKLPSLLAVAFACTLCSCSSLPENTVTIDQYKAWENGAPLKAREFRITARIEDKKGGVTNLGTMTAKAGEEVASVSAKRELIYPTEFDLPETLRTEEGQGDGSKGSAFPVTPTTPTAFTMRPLGDELRITAKPKGSFVELRGSLSTTTGELDLYRHGIRSRAEAVSPISDSRKRFLLTENLVLQPEFRTTESLFYSAGLVSSEHRIALKNSKRTLVVKCEVVR